ncbi:MAG: hypothetical protein IT200_11955 [Thermoleophilia bacterium]|nr:hypothetical protein [Thermoleophilia bacterium]
MTPVRVVVPEPGLAAGIPGVETEPEHPEDVVLLRAAADGAGVPAGAAVARALGAATVLLPPGRVEARWVAAVAGTWAADTTPDLGRAVQSLVSMLAGGDPGALIRRPDPDGTPAASLPLPVLARLAIRAWRPCPHCAGGGVVRGTCGGCGRPMEAAA